MKTLKEFLNEIKQLKKSSNEIKFPAKNKKTKAELNKEFKKLQKISTKDLRKMATKLDPRISFENENRFNAIRKILFKDFDSLEVNNLLGRKNLSNINNKRTLSAKDIINSRDDLIKQLRSRAK